MRFTKLHLQYFGPYRDTTIDFTEFSEAPVFLISGQTGSGKTTILMRWSMRCMAKRPVKNVMGARCAPSLRQPLTIRR